MAEENHKCSELLDLVIDGQASREQELELMEHVRSCPNCKNEFELNTSIKESLKARLRQLSTPEGLTDSIQSKILELAS